jgi:Tol biopolymer transport system component
MGFDGQPRFSPDGELIVFVSDRSGSENLWVVAPDGTRPRQVTRGDNAQYVSPEWTPDGTYIAVSRSENGILGSKYDLTLVHREGGAGVKLTGKGTAAGPPAPPTPLTPPPLDNYLGAAFGPDGRYIYAAARRGQFGYNLTLKSSESWQVAVYDRETGKTFLRTAAVGSGMRPAVSPDGKYLAYATRLDTATALRIRDLASGDERWLAPAIQRDDMESRYTRDLLPGYAFTPDAKAVVLSYGGRFWRLDVASGAATAIPFTADVEQRMGPLVRSTYEINDSTLTVNQIRNARPSPDGRRLAFTALDKLWVMDLPRGTPRRLTTSRVGEHSPAWSPDGRHVAYVTWTEEGGDVYRVRSDGRGAPERLTRQRAFYEQLNYTPDGRRLVVARGPRQQRVERENEFEGPGPQVVELVWLPAAGGAARTITPLSFYGRPHFTRDTSRVFIYDPADGLLSMRFDGTDRKAIVKVTGYTMPGADPEEEPPTPADEVIVSPDGARAIAAVNNKVYIVAVPMTGGRTPTVSVQDPAAAPVPIRRATRIGGDFLGWRDSTRFYYSLGHSYFTYDVARADSLVRDSTSRADSLKRAGGDTAAGAAGADAARRRAGRADTARAGGRAEEQVALAPADSARVARGDTAKPAKPAYEPDRIDVLITVPRDRPRGTVVLRNARVITMRGNEVIERGDVVVTDNRIAAVGAAGTVAVPAGARTIDVAGKTILPGWVDIHAHMWPTWGVHRTQVYEYLANLAYGVTTTRDPQTSTTDVLSYGDLVETGEMLGPRVFSTGPGVFWSDEITSLEDARDVLRRYSDFYNTRTIKQYLAGDRRVRQWVVMASRELGLTPTLEGGLDFKKNLTEALDGYAGSEHSYPITPLYNDAIRLLAASGITNTPTLLVAYGGPWAENYFFERHDIHADAKLRRFTPHAEIDRRALRRDGWFRADQYSFPRIAAQSAKLVAAGGRVGLGGHGQLQGLGDHWELWAIASGGMPLHDVLRVGTIFGAEAIGLERQIGSLEAGKLADLQVLDANPLADIRNTNTVRYVMRNGRLYEAETLREIWPRVRDIPTPWWHNRDPAPAVRATP